MNNCPFVNPRRDCPDCSMYQPSQEYSCTLDATVFADQLGNKVSYQGSYPGLSRVTNETFDSETMELLAGFNEDTV